MRELKAISGQVHNNNHRKNCDRSMNRSCDYYDRIKWEFFGALKKRNLGYKGDIRSLIGILTWKFEQDSENYPVQKRHINAFCEAVTQLKSYKSPDDLISDFASLKEEWRQRGPISSYEIFEKPIVDSPVKNITKWHHNGFNFVSLFSGAFGLDLGFLGAGFNPLIAVDIEESSEKTLGNNLPDLPFIREDIKKVKTKTILEGAGLDVGELDVVTGGPPCQPFSTAGKRAGLLDPRASPLTEFIRFVKEARPKYFVMEEVTGLLSARLTHVPISERNGRVFSNEEMTGSVFNVIVDMLRSTGYSLSLSNDPSRYKNSILNAADYGAPQIRNRIIIIGGRDMKPELPSPTHGETPFLSFDNWQGRPWNTFWEATCDLQNKEMECGKLTPQARKYLDFVPPGGNWRDLPKDCVEEAMGKAYTSGGGKMGYFRRLSWDYPCPTVTTAPAQAATMLCHPEDLRPMSVEEYKRVQGFPDDWQLEGSTATKYLLIGNAVPVHLSYAIANQVQNFLNAS